MVMIKRVFLKIREKIRREKIIREAVTFMSECRPWTDNMVFSQWRADIGEAKNRLQAAVFDRKSTEDIEERLRQAKHLWNHYTTLSDLIDFSVDSKERDEMYRPHAEKLGYFGDSRDGAICD